MLQKNIYVCIISYEVMTGENRVFFIFNKHFNYHTIINILSCLSSNKNLYLTNPMINFTSIR